jgi:Uma2 family endonuclease
MTTAQAELDELLADVLPRQGAWDSEGYLWLTDRTNRLVEFAEGRIELLPVPTHEHQAILKYLFLAFHAFLHPRGGTVFFAPLRVQVRPGIFREPDLVLLRDARDPRLQNRYWLGADLVLEIVSADQPARDLVEKRADYASAGIPEYWIVDPRVATITVLRLEGDAYVEHGVIGRGARATSALLTGFEVDVTAVFDAR